MSWLRRRLVNPILALLKQGITPEKIALSVALGAALGVFPVLGSTTLLCAAAALLFKLNLPAIQAVNYLVYPLQLALFIPFLETGQRVFGGATPEVTWAQVFTMLRTDLWGAIAKLWSATVYAMLLWLAVAPVFVALVYLVLTPVLRRAGRAFTAARAAASPSPPV